MRTSNRSSPAKAGEPKDTSLIATYSGGNFTNSPRPAGLPAELHVTNASKPIERAGWTRCEVLPVPGTMFWRNPNGSETVAASFGISGTSHTAALVLLPTPADAFQYCKDVLIPLVLADSFVGFPSAAEDLVSGFNPLSELTEQLEQLRTTGFPIDRDQLNARQNRRRRSD